MGGASVGNSRGWKSRLFGRMQYRGGGYETAQKRATRAGIIGAMGVRARAAGAAPNIANVRRVSYSA